MPDHGSLVVERVARRASRVARCTDFIRRHNTIGNMTTEKTSIAGHRKFQIIVSPPNVDQAKTLTSSKVKASR